MTLNEAIKHCEDVVAKYEIQAANSMSKEGEDYNCQCAEEHQQLAAWLQELKEAKKFIRKVENELMKGTSFYSTSFLEENRELFDKLTEGLEYLDD